MSVARAKVLEGDCVAVMRRLPDSSIDAIVCDPPYGLAFMGREWDRFEDAPRRTPGTGGREAPHAHHAVPLTAERNQAFQRWCTAWTQEALRVLKPGGHLVAFGGSRTYHRLACAIEDAGFEMRDCLLWLYAEGFPKGLDVGKAFDKANGAERTPQRHAPRAATSGKFVGREAQDTWIERGRAVGYMETAGPEPVSDEAKQWDGWNTSLKPAYEPIVLARKPLSERTLVENIRRWGTGALNIGATRIGTEQRTNGPAAAAPGTFNASPGSGTEYVGRTVSGRWPPNVALSHAEGCEQVGTRKLKVTEGFRPNPVRVQSDGRIKFSQKAPGFQKQSYTDADGTETVAAWRCVPGCPVALVDAASGSVGGTKAPAKPNKKAGQPKNNRVYGAMTYTEGGAYYGDKGGASRLFFVAKADNQQRFVSTYCKCPTQQHADKGQRCKTCGREIRPMTHPTVKPVALMRWLIRLVCPRGGVVLDVFGGSGSTGVAALAEGTRVLLIEKDPAYAALARQRLARTQPTWDMESPHE